MEPIAAATPAPDISPEIAHAIEEAPELSPEKSAELERRKLQLEIDELTHWWRRPQVLAGCGPSALAILGVLTAFWAGFFDKARLEFERSELSVQVGDLTAAKGNLESQVSSLRGQERELTARIQLTEKAQRQAQSELNSLVQTAAREINAREGALSDQAERYQALELQLHEQSNRAATAEQLASEAQSRSTQDRESVRELREQLALLPPHVSGSSLLLHQEDSRIYGGVFGSNFGEQPGTVLLQIISVNPRSRDTDVADQGRAALLSMSVEPEFIHEWKWFRVNFYLSPDNRLAVLELRKRLRSIPMDTNPTDIHLGDGFAYRARIQTAIGKQSNWESVTLFDRELEDN